RPPARRGPPRPPAIRARASLAAPLADGEPGLLQRRLPQLVAGRPVAEPGAQLGAVTRSGHIAQVRLVLERVGVLLVVAAEADVLARALHHGARPVLAVLVHVDRAGAVADLALHVAQGLVERQRGAARLIPAGHVAADAVVGGLLVPLDQGLPGAGVAGLLPELDRVGVAEAALLHAGEARLARRRRRRRAPGLRLGQVDLCDGAVELLLGLPGLAVAGEPLADRDLREGEPVALFRSEQRALVEPGALLLEPGQLVLLLRQEALVGAGILLPAGDVLAQRRDARVERGDAAGAERVGERPGAAHRALQARDPPAA